MNRRKQKLLVFAKLGEVRTGELENLLGISYKVGSKYLREFVAEGILRRKRKGVYEITPKGTELIEKLKPRCEIFVVGEIKNGS